MKPPDRIAVPSPHEAYATVALVLQGGGALGSYQAGVYEGLDEQGIRPNWVAGVSIGALNAAVIAGNPPETRVAQLRAFWNHICRQPWWPALPDDARADGHLSDLWRRWVGQVDATRALLEGQNGFFVPRPLVELWPSLLATTTPTATTPAAAGTASYYDTSPLRATLERFADFERINRPQEMRVSISAVEVESGNLRTFDNTRDTLRPEHFMASGALPPGFPAVEVDGVAYWDGGLVSNTPLFEVLRSEPRRDALVFQVDLWSATGAVPTTLAEVADRQKEIQFSSRTRMVTDYMDEQQSLRRRILELLELLSPESRNAPAAQRAAAFACDRRCNVIQLVYADKPYEGGAKDYQFGVLSLRDHWASGLKDIRETLADPGCLAMPGADQPFASHDVHRERRRPADVKTPAGG